jgi:hypothetical protein
LNEEEIKMDVEVDVDVDNVNLQFNEKKSTYKCFEMLNDRTINFFEEDHDIFSWNIN